MIFYLILAYLFVGFLFACRFMYNCGRWYDANEKIVLFAGTIIAWLPVCIYEIYDNWDKFPKIF